LAYTKSRPALLGENQTTPGEDGLGTRPASGIWWPAADAPGHATTAAAPQRARVQSETHDHAGQVP